MEKRRRKFFVGKEIFRQSHQFKNIMEINIQSKNDLMYEYERIFLTNESVLIQISFYINS